jgi:hypothetical protein
LRVRDKKKQKGEYMKEKELLRGRKKTIIGEEKGGK